MFYKFVYIPFSKHFSFAKILQPPDRCVKSRSWLNSMLITQVHILGTIKCAVLSQDNTTNVSSWGSVQLAWMSAIAVATEFHVNLSTISSRQRCFREFGNMSNRPHKRKPRVPPIRDHHIQLIHLWDCRICPPTKHHMQSVNTELRSNRTTPAPTPVGCRRACKCLQTTKGSTAKNCPVTSLPVELNYFYAHVEESNTETCMRASAVPYDCDYTLRSRCEWSL
jgi:hypothetical protein